MTSPAPDLDPVAKRQKTDPTTAPPVSAPAPTAAPSMSSSPPLLIKKLSTQARLPMRGSAFAAGYDLYAARDTTVPTRGKALVDTDLSMAVPSGTCECFLRLALHRLFLLLLLLLLRLLSPLRVHLTAAFSATPARRYSGPCADPVRPLPPPDGRVAPRSGLASKHMIDTGAGVIDADYRGHVRVLLFNHGEAEFKVAAGERIAQLVLERICTPEVEEVEELEESVRGEGGFGSTG